MVTGIDTIVSGWQAGLGEYMDGAYGELATYSRGSDSFKILAAFASSQIGRVTEEQTLVRDSTARDFLLQADLMFLDGAEITPAPGDTLTFTSGLTFELAGSDDEPCWEWSHERTRYKIHTNEIKGS